MQLLMRCALPAIMISGALAQPMALSPAPDYADQPAMAVTAAGEVFAAWVSYSGAAADTIRYRRHSAGQWSAPAEVTEVPGDYHKVALAAAGDTVWFVWGAQIDGNADLYGRTLTGDDWSTIVRLTDNPQPDIHHRLLADSQGRLYLCWQSFRTGDGNIYLKVFEDGSWSAPIAITTHEAGDWEPDIALDPQNRLHIVYDTYRHGDYDVLLRIYDRGELSAEHVIAGTDSFEARPTIACDREGRAWIAWDNQGPGWGLDRPFWNLDSKQGDWGEVAEWAADEPPGVSSKVSLRYTQSIGTAVFAKGRTWTPRGNLADALGQQLALTYEIPQLTTDARGTPWMFFRRWVARNDGSGMAVRPGGWDIYATHYSGGAWSPPQLLRESTGSNDQRVATAIGPDSRLWVAYPADRRLSSEGAIKVQKERHGVVYLASLEATPPREPLLVERQSVAARPYKRTASTDRRNGIAAGEKRYQLYWGDLHRHTEISGDGGYDGTLWDMYRYAMDVAELDFIASTDHYYGGSDRGNGQTYDWWRTQKYADLLHVRGRFLPLFGYERSLRWPYGHRNVINLKRGTTAVDTAIGGDDYADGAPRKPDEVGLWKAIRGQDVITIPHTIASGAGTNWAFNDPALEPLMEIFQGCRLSYETAGAPRVASGQGLKEDGTAWSALSKGYKVGFIASSDHRSTHISYAAVYAEAPTREAIFRALQQRHAYAATDNIVVDVRIGDAILGDVLQTDRIPELHIAVRGTAPIHQIEIIKNGAYVYRSTPNEQNVAFTFRDTAAEPGDSYYYVRVQQADSQMAWASPIWVEYR